jgi:hypothetical protein
LHVVEVEHALSLSVGDDLLLTPAEVPGKAAEDNEDEIVYQPAQIGCSPMLVICGIPASSRCAMIKSRQRSFGKLESNSHLKRRKVREAFRRSPWLL